MSVKKGCLLKAWMKIQAFLFSGWPQSIWLMNEDPHARMS